MVQAEVGFAADAHGHGVAYARLATRSGERLVRAAFRVARLSGVDGREVGYAALTSIARRLRDHGLSDVAFAVADASLVEDRGRSTGLPRALVMPYVRLRCALNAFGHATLRACEPGDLTARARAEVALHSAA